MLVYCGKRSWASFNDCCLRYLADCGGPEGKMKSIDLTITPKPFKSSRLAIPHSPFTPRLPITPPATPPQARTSPEQSHASLFQRLEFPAPPPEPLHWLWQCHMCNRTYRLGVTRHCLEDSHFFCAGTTTVKRNKRTGARKVIRHRACASEFDYQAWKVWGNWRRSIVEQLEVAAAMEALLEGDGLPVSIPEAYNASNWPLGGKKLNRKDCWATCDYPSECRWSNQNNAPPSPKPMSVVVPSMKPEIAPMIMEETPPEQPPRATFSLPDDNTKKPSMDDLLESAKRRKRRSASFVASPLASNPPSQAVSEASNSTAQALQRAFDDFELDFRKSFGRAGALVSNLVSSPNKRNSVEKEKREYGNGRKKSASGIV